MSPVVLFTTLVVVLFSVVPPAVGQEAEPPAREPYRDPTTFALRSLVVPGWGQLGLDRGERGSTYFLLAAASLPVAVGAIGLPLIEDANFEQAIGIGAYVLIAALSSVDAYETAQALNVENGYELDVASGPGARPDRTVSIPLLHRRF